MIASRASRTIVGLALAALVLATPVASHAAATIVINNINGAGVGFNDPAPAAPVGGNPGTTLGAQRLNAFVHAAGIWGAELDSTVTIIVNAQFSALTCTATGAVLGSAGPTSIHRDFTGAPVAGHWYHQALANKLFGSDLSANNDINANFNVNLGAPNCLAGSPFYLGFDANHGTGIDLVAVLLHEFAHGLGFSTTTSGTSGNFNSGFPSIYDRFNFIKLLGKTWDDATVTAAQRVASAISVNGLQWSGPQVTADWPSVLLGTPQVKVTAPAAAVAAYDAGTAGFGPSIATPAGYFSGQMMPLTGAAGGNQLLACEALNAGNAAAVNGRVALIDRGVCTFVVKVKNAQNAGAIAVVIANNAAGPAPGLGGGDPTIVIPTVSVSQADGNALKAALAKRSRTASGVLVNLFFDPTRIAGVDPTTNQVLLYAPNPFASGSSVSHFDTTAFRNLLMEPAINGDLTHSVKPPQDLTKSQLKDIGW